jgi:5-methylcytosine-specific restriction endonuclease McrA
MRAIVLLRDGYRCVKCGVKVAGLGAARVDHIKSRETHPELELAMDNLRTLCPECDNRSHREKTRRNFTGRDERFAGSDVNGWPIDR